MIQQKLAKNHLYITSRPIDMTGSKYTIWDYNYQTCEKFEICFETIKHYEAYYVQELGIMIAYINLEEEKKVSKKHYDSVIKEYCSNTATFKWIKIDDPNKPIRFNDFDPKPYKSLNISHIQPGGPAIDPDELNEPEFDEDEDEN